jgi:hypothetical protein
MNTLESMNLAVNGNNGNVSIHCIRGKTYNVQCQHIVLTFQVKTVPSCSDGCKTALEKLVLLVTPRLSCVTHP